MRKIENEKWKTLLFHKAANGKSYAISNYGRLVCYTEKVTDGTLVKGSLQEGYPIWRFRKKLKDGTVQYFGFLLHRLVAENFLPKAKRGETLVIHNNHKKTDNHFSNLSWATIAETSAHAQTSPRVIKAKKIARESGNGGNTKLTIEKVIKIKKLLKQGKTLKEIAMKYNVSDMQIYRIKIGENWGYIK